ncbi:MAG: rod shape-determining protein MreC [Chitinophagales bacterium]|nr:rod shape-determining protein MreC [Chitinophagales bacterium]
MRNLFYLIERFHLLIALLILEGIALALLRKDNVYQDSIIGNASASVSGQINTARNNVVQYFDLKDENKRLANENIFLLSQLNYEKKIPIDSTLPSQSETALFDYIVAQVIDNDVTQSVNYLMINKGAKDGVERGLGVVTGSGVVGIVTHVSNNYSLVMSAISTKSRISVKHKGTDAFGNLTWDGTDPWRLSVDNVSKTNTVAKGDTFYTAGYSNFFPPEIPTAIVTDVEQDPSTSFLYIDVVLAYDMDKLNYVYIVKSKDKPQIDSLKSLILN